MSLSDDIIQLEKVLGYTFTDSSLLITALTHSSFDDENYQKLEFLGDSILDFLIADYIVNKYPECDEAFATKARAALVSEKPLAEFFKKWELINYIRIKNVNLKAMSDKFKSDFVEAIVGAIYVDNGFECVKDFVSRNFCKPVDNVEVKDYKSSLLEYVAQNKLEKSFEYMQSGPDHDKTFKVILTVGKISTVGSGKKKRDAEQQACKAALEVFGKCTL